jgi:hypothetical protein
MQQYRVIDAPLETGGLRGGGVRIDSNKVLAAGAPIEGEGLADASR